MRNLFRDQVLSKKVEQLGRPLIIRNDFLRKISLGTLLLALLLLLSMFWVTHSRKLEVTGVVTPDSAMTRIVSTQAGVISKIYVSDGERVKSGQALYKITLDRHFQQQLSIGEQSLASIKRRKDFAVTEMEQQKKLDQLKLQSLLTQIDKYPSEISSIRAALDGQSQRIQIAKSRFEMEEKLVRENFMSAPALSVKQEAIIEQEQRKQEFTRQLLNLERNYEAMQVEIIDTRARLAQSQTALEKQLEILEQEESSQKSTNTIFIVSPRDGIFSSVSANFGDFISAGQTVGSVKGNQIHTKIDLLIPTSSPANVVVGQSVVVSLKSFPYQRYGFLKGKIISVSGFPLSPKDLVHLPISLNASEYYFRAVVQVDARWRDGEILSNGLSVDATIKLEERTLFEWLMSSAVVKIQRARS